MFYSQLNGIFLVYDMVNRNSYQNLRKWIRELVQTDVERGIEEIVYHNNNQSEHGDTSVHSAFAQNDLEAFPLSHESKSFQSSLASSSSSKNIAGILDILAASSSSSSSALASHSSSSSSSSASAASPHYGPLFDPLVASTSTSSLLSLADLRSDYSTSALGSLPIFVIGNKVDLLDQRNDKLGGGPRYYNPSIDFGLPSADVSSLANSLIPGADPCIELQPFFNQIIQRRYYRAGERGGKAAAAFAVAAGGDLHAVSSFPDLSTLTLPSSTSSSSSSSFLTSRLPHAAVYSPAASVVSSIYTTPSSLLSSATFYSSATATSLSAHPAALASSSTSASSASASSSSSSAGREFSFPLHKKKDSSGAGGEGGKHNLSIDIPYFFERPLDRPNNNNGGPLTLN